MDIPKRPVKILVLEDNFQWQTIIREVARVCGITNVVIVDSIQGFRDKFSPGEFRAVLLDNQVIDGEAIRKGLAEWVRWHDDGIRIGLISGSNLQTAPMTRAVYLGKNDSNINDFLREIANPKVMAQKNSGSR